MTDSFLLVDISLIMMTVD